MRQTLCTVVALFAVALAPATGLVCAWTCAGHDTPQGHHVHHVHGGTTATPAASAVSANHGCAGHPEAGPAVNTSTAHIDASTAITEVASSGAVAPVQAPASHRGQWAAGLDPPRSLRSAILRI